VPKRIFIVDDSKTVRQLVRTYLETRLEYIVCAEATDGLDAIQRAREVKPDLIVLDLSMPLMNGLEAARILNELMPAVPKILFTLHAQALMMADLKTAGIDRVVAKSDMTELIGHSENLVKAA